MRRNIVAKIALNQEAKTWSEKNASKGVDLKALAAAILALETAQGKRKALAEQAKELSGQEKLATKALKVAFETAKAGKKALKAQAKSAEKTVANPNQPTEKTAKPAPAK